MAYFRKNVRGTKGCKRDSRIPKKWSELLNKCEKSRKKAKYAVFME